MRKKIAWTASALLAAGAFAASSAPAHHPTAVVADTAGCVTSSKSNVTITYVSTEGTRFYGTVSVNGAPVGSWDFVVHGGGGQLVTQTITVPYTAPVGTFGLSAQWAFSTGETGTWPAMTLTCSAPAPPPAATAPPTAAPPTPATPTTATPPAPAKTGSSTTTGKTPRRFGIPGQPTKKCKYGRKHLTDSKGRHFTDCKSKPKPPVFRHPSFTG